MNSSLTDQIAVTISVVLFEYGPLFSKRPDLSRKGPISANFLARSARQLQAIYLLAEHDHVACGWQLYRSLLERYLLYVKLNEKNEFAVFDDWCFKRYYEYENRLRSSPDLKKIVDVQQRDFVQRGKERYDRVSREPAVCAWRRPDVETSAKSLNLKFLYDAGYDYASGLVHPMSTDGYNDYLRLVAKVEMVKDEGKAILVGNSQLIVTMLLRQFLNQPEFNWRHVLYDLIDAFRATIHDPQADVMTALQKVMLLSKHGHGLAMPTDSTD